MELWIRSQNKKNLMKAEDIVAVDNYIEVFKQNDESTRVAGYKTKKRALEVLDEIEGILMFARLEKVTGNNFINVENNVAIYEMPEE